MNLCSDGHYEVCYEGRECPACNLMKDRDYFETELSKLEEELSSANKYIEYLENQINNK